MSKYKKLPAVLLGLAFVMPSPSAHAATAERTVYVSFTINGQCTVNGGAVNLGTFLTRNNWSDVANSLGYYAPVSRGVLAGYKQGTRGLEYANYGTLTCDNGTQYTLDIAGSGSSKSIKIQMGANTVSFRPILKRVGSDVVPDNGTDAVLVGTGHHFAEGVYSGVGIGVAQELRGSAIIDASAGSETTARFDSSLEDRLLLGSWTDTLRYTVNF